MIVFIADFFADEILGGGELNNQELIKLLRSKGHIVNAKKSRDTDAAYITNCGAQLFIVGNFMGLSVAARAALKLQNYIIYEHDHKYLRTRNPAKYDNFKAPPNELVNVDFYLKAKKVLCQTTFHATIVKRNLGLDNIESVGGNLWSEEALQMLERLSDREKEDKCSILNSPIPHKNTSTAIRYCEATGKEYVLCSESNYHSFLEKLGENDTLVFFPQTPETLSRIVVESRMMGMKVITNKLVGATQENWFELKGLDLIEKMRAKREEIPELVIGLML
jgi:YHS domain-containing protein